MAIKQEYDLALAEDIFGYQTHDELLWLAEQASSRYLIVELGSYNGRSTRAMADNCPGIIWAIDCWEQMEYMPRMEGDPWMHFQSNLRKHLDSSLVRAVRMRHEDVHAFVLPELRRLDMVYIDGDHSVEAVRRDIIEWRARLVPGGLLCGHDAHDANWPGVDQAVGELIPDVQYVPGTALWWTRV